MKLTILLYSTIFLQTLVGGNCNSGGQIISWAENRELQWKDYKGTPLSSSEHDAVSYIQLRIKYKFEPIFRCDIKCTFWIENSWTKTTSNHLLGHEQAHFDIGEIYARKLREAVEFNKAQILRKGSIYLDSLYRAHVKKLEVEQKQYDLETNYSRDHDNQMYWYLQIEKRLDSLKDFRR